MRHIGKRHSFITPHQKILLSFMLQLIYSLWETNSIIHLYVRLFVPTASKDVVAMMQSLCFVFCSYGLCMTNDTFQILQPFQKSGYW